MPPENIHPWDTEESFKKINKILKVLQYKCELRATGKICTISKIYIMECCFTSYIAFITIKNYSYEQDSLI